MLEFFEIETLTCIMHGDFLLFFSEGATAIEKVYSDPDDSTGIRGLRDRTRSNTKPTQIAEKNENQSVSR